MNIENFKSVDKFVTIVEKLKPRDQEKILKEFEELVEEAEELSKPKPAKLDPLSLN